MATYVGIYTESNGEWNVHKDGERLSPDPSLKLQNHSPDGFSWGYNGSGPAQLALALLLDVTGDAAMAAHWYQRFKSSFIAKLPVHGGWTITSEGVEAWLRSARERWPVRAAREVAP